MTSALPRPCRGRGCANVVRGKPYCYGCQRQRDRAKRARRPDLHTDAAERQRRARVVADHRAIVGDWCPGWQGRPAHPSADLTADHVKEVAAGGRPDGRLVVRCRSCNAARSAHLARRALQTMAGPNPGRWGSTTPPLPPVGTDARPAGTRQDNHRPTRVLTGQQASDPATGEAPNGPNFPPNLVESDGPVVA